MGSPAASAEVQPSGRWGILGLLRLNTAPLPHDHLPASGGREGVGVGGWWWRGGVERGVGALAARTGHVGGWGAIVALEQGASEVVTDEDVAVAVAGGGGAPWIRALHLGVEGEGVGACTHGRAGRGGHTHARAVWQAHGAQGK